MERRDYYEVLGVAQNAPDQEIKRAYRKLAMEFHPDRNSSPDAEERFKEASEAYEVLSDQNKRRIYDRAGFDGLRSTGFSGFSGVGVEDIFSQFGDLFGDMFGFGARGRRGPAVERGSDLRYDLVIEFEEAVFGVENEVELTHLVGCEKCAGSGAKPGSRVTRCATCRGRGQIIHGQGLFLLSTTCPDCQGQGSRQSDPCTECRGDGRARGRRSVNVRIPAGFDDGMSLRYGGEGEPGPRGGPPGDLYVAVRVKPHETLRREGDDLYTELAIDMVQASLGAERTVQGVDGEVPVDIPSGTQPGDVVTIKRMGVPRLRGSGRGNLYIVCRVEIPKSLTKKQRELLEEFAGATSSKTKKRRLFS
ncbi:MAG: molecular chaperone DnaJ [Myxococcota bacterium]